MSPRSPTKVATCLLLLCASLLCPGCKETVSSSEPARDPPAAAPAAVAWPATPADGSQLAVHVIHMFGEGQRRGALVQFFNFSDTPIERADIRLRYYDANDREVGTFPQRLVGRPLLSARAEHKLRVGGLVPAETVRMTVHARAILRVNGSQWLSTEDPPEDLQHNVIQEPLNLRPTLTP